MSVPALCIRGDVLNVWERMWGTRSVLSTTQAHFCGDSSPALWSTNGLSSHIASEVVLQYGNEGYVQYRPDTWGKTREMCVMLVGNAVNCYGFAKCLPTKERLLLNAYIHHHKCLHEHTCTLTHATHGPPPPPTTTHTRHTFARPG